MDVEATPAHRTAEVDSTRTMVERVEAQFDLTPDQALSLTNDPGRQFNSSYRPLVVNTLTGALVGAPTKKYK